MKQNKKNQIDDTTSIDISEINDKTDTLSNVVIRHNIEEEEEIDFNSKDKSGKSSKTIIIILAILLIVILGVIGYLLLK